MAKLILGIHGLANKPLREQLQDWWRQALQEGLAKNCGHREAVEFRMVYWADLLYSQPLHTNAAFNFDSLYTPSPTGPPSRAP